MTRKERIAVIKECEKALYDMCTDHNADFTHAELVGVRRAEQQLFKKRKRLEGKLKK